MSEKRQPKFLETSWWTTFHLNKERFDTPQEPRRAAEPLRLLLSFICIINLLQHLSQLKPLAGTLSQTRLSHFSSITLSPPPSATTSSMLIQTAAIAIVFVLSARAYMYFLGGRDAYVFVAMRARFMSTAVSLSWCIDVAAVIAGIGMVGSSARAGSSLRWTLRRFSLARWWRTIFVVASISAVQQLAVELFLSKSWKFIACLRFGIFEVEFDSWWHIKIPRREQFHMRPLHLISLHMRPLHLISHLHDLLNWCLQLVLYQYGAVGTVDRYCFNLLASS